MKPVVSLNLATILLALAISTITSVAGFLIWWFFDQRSFWVVTVDGNDNVDWFKQKAEGDMLRIDRYEEPLEVPLEPSKHKHRVGWRSGKCVFVDLAKGVQVDPKSDVNNRVGYDTARLVDSKFGESWRKGFPDDGGIGKILAEFLATYGWMFVLINFMIGVAYIWRAA